MDISEILASLSKEDIEQLSGVASSILGEKSDELKTADSGGLGKLLGTEDNRVALIKALKPMLSEPRQKKADEALKLLKLMQLVPLLKDSGLLSDLL